LGKYDAVRDRLRELGEASEDRWDALRGGFESAWQTFKDRYDEVMAEHRGQG
jgi:hypothetical protein